jgi:D-Tyr-tRNAtyr deacylase
VVQRVSRRGAGGGEVVGEIGGGLLVLAAFAPDDTADELAGRRASCRTCGSSATMRG